MLVHRTFAEIAQLVEHNLAKVGVASSSLVFRSKSKGWLNASLFDFRIIRFRQSDHTPLSGAGGVNIVREKLPREACVIYSDVHIGQRNQVIRMAV